MKRFAFFLLPVLFLAACAQDGAETETSDTAGVADAFSDDDQMMAEMGTVVGEDPGDGAVLFVNQVVADPAAYDGQPVRVAGVVSEVCQNAGCWLTFMNDEGTPFRVSVPRDDNGYVFTFPTDISGQNAVIAGTFAVEQTDVETLRHLAEDEGQTEEQIAAITEPQRTLTLTATGARLEGDLVEGEI